MDRTHRLYVDESGDHTYHYQATEPGKRYLCLAGVMIETEHYRTSFHPALQALKQQHFPHNPDEPLILPREDIVNKRGPFRRLRDPSLEEAFNQELLDFLADEDYTLFAVVIDKVSHAERYGEHAWHPYHYCIAAMIERYCGRLNFLGDVGDVMAESRGGREDNQLKTAYRSIYDAGTYHRQPQFFQQSLTSREIKLKPKRANIAGLQVADLLSRACLRDVLGQAAGQTQIMQVFDDKIRNVIQAKYNRQLYENRIAGYGRVFLK